MESTFRPAMLLMAGRTMGFVAAFCIPVVLARIFDQTEFGTYKQIFLIAATLYTIGQLGMAESLLYFLPLGPRHGARYATNSLLALVGGGAACLVFLAMAGEPVSRWLGNPALARYTTLLGVYLLLMLTSAVLELVMIARKRYSWASRSYVALDFCRAGFLIIPPLFVPELQWLLLGAVGFAALRCAVTLWYLFYEFDGELRPDAGLLRAQVAYALPFQLSGIVETFQTNLHQYVVAHHFDAATFAIYAVGCLQVPLVEVVFASVVNVMMVRMAEELRDGRDAAAMAIWHDGARKLALLFFPLALLLAVTSRQVIVLLFTENYAASAPIFMVSALGLLMPPLLVDGVLRVYAQTRLLFVLNLVRLGVMVAVLGWFLDVFHLVGPLLATLLAGCVMRALALARIRQLMRVSMAQVLPWRSLAGILAAAAVAAGPALIVKWELGLPTLPLLLATSCVYGVTYLAAVRRFRLLSVEEERAVRAWIGQQIGALLRAIAWAKAEPGGPGR